MSASSQATNGQNKIAEPLGFDLLIYRVKKYFGRLDPYLTLLGHILMAVHVLGPLRGIANMEIHQASRASSCVKGLVLNYALSGHINFHCGILRTHRRKLP